MKLVLGVTQGRKALADWRFPEQVYCQKASANSWSPPSRLLTTVAIVLESDSCLQVEPACLCCPSSSPMPGHLPGAPWSHPHGAPARVDRMGPTSGRVAP